MNKLLGQLKQRTPQAVRNALRPYIYAGFRQATAARSLVAESGSFPDFFVLGVQKGGTTTLYDALVQHPDIVPARTKEISFFDRHWSYGIDWYLHNFPQLTRGSTKITGEATPDYIFASEVPTRIRALATNTPKFIVLLRNPVDRAISHYFHALRLGIEQEPIERAFELEAQRLGETAGELVGPALDKRTNRFSFSYVERGYYAKQLTNWFEIFDRSCFFIETSERFFSEPHAVLHSALEFLGLPEVPLKRMSPKNTGRYTSAIPKSVYSYLNTKFRDENQVLKDMVDCEITW